MELLSQISLVWVVAFLITMTAARAWIHVLEKRPYGSQKAADPEIADQPRPHADREKQLRILHFAGEVIESLTIAGVLVFLVVRPFIVQAFYIPSQSMDPTLAQQDRILVNKLAYRLGELKRHDVVVFRAPSAATGEPEELVELDYVKRVVGLPGDLVEIHDGITYVNGYPEREPYTREPPESDLSPFTVPPGKIFVMGDNRNHSNDSRRWGALDLDRVIGRADLIFWPPSRAGRIR